MSGEKLGELERVERMDNIEGEWSAIAQQIREGRRFLRGNPEADNRFQAADEVATLCERSDELLSEFNLHRAIMLGEVVVDDSLQPRNSL